MKKTQSASDINEREAALDILMSGDVFLNEAIDAFFEKHPGIDKRSRAFIEALCVGVTERRLTLDHIISGFSTVKLKKMKPVVLWALRLGVYQLKYMDLVPPSAAVNESVKLVKKRGLAGLSGFVNAILRKVSASDVDAGFDGDLSLRYSTPEWIADLFVKTYGEEMAEKMLSASLEKAPLTARVCPGVNVTALAEELASEGAKAHPFECMEGVIFIDSLSSLNTCTAFLEGRFTIQDVSSQLVGYIASHISAKTVLDICAAPGGKALHAAQVLEGSHVLARDISEKKLSRIRENAKRLGCENITLEKFDATVFDEKSADAFDLVIADLPCSGLGVMGRKCDLKYRVSPEDIESLAALQKTILENAARYVKAGGYILYSTCTVTEAENVKQVENFLKEHSFESVPIDDKLPEVFRHESAASGYVQLLQGVDPCDGFFIALMKRLS
ncbi:MAG: 16S rRNA (cytosine(967)-C(5))-methyltransferase RsmB [Lachnospiraceae bacterium]|nr:16S rRNA (cytosine(967)-C(5))-methyltransferase RsmB [Lachnospiraceae bacterium]